MAAESIPAQIAAACRAVRPAGPEDAVAGVQPSIVAAPASTAEASALLRAAADLGLAVLPRGTGSRLHWGNPPQRCDLVIETTSMDRIVEHAAGDLVATVQAGTGLDRLAEVLSAAGQRLALDPPGRGTVGGALATGAAGPLRLRYGTGRDLLIGITVVRADGTVARSGGKVVKNVAGYDLGKLFAGSRGTLGLIAEATFRLHPAPAAAAYVTVEWAAAIEGCRLLAAALESPLAPVAAELDWPTAGAPVQVGILLEGDARGVAERAELLADLLTQEAGLPGALAHLASAAGAAGGPGPAVRQGPPPWWGAGPAAQRDGTVLQVAFWPGDLGLILAEIRAAAQDAGLDPAIGGSAAGVLYAAVPAIADAAQVAAFVTALRGAFGHGLPGQAGHRLAEVPQPLAGVGRPAHGHHRAPAGRPAADSPDASNGDEPAGPGQPRPPGGPPARANVVVLHAPAAVRGLVDLFGPVPSLPLMRAVKDQFDPDRIMAPGRFAGGI